VHQLYGQSFELSRLPVAQDGALNRILYFDDQNQLLRIWVNFGHSDRSGWDENFRLTAARERYTALKTEHAGALGPGACDEPSIGGSVGALDEARFPPDKAVWSCA
ncbi:MAG: hypothetical protein GWO40_01035, partial [Gammaproteobacteria bacterium]|nr:hypothetical protein [Gammaproteobacteria bacterium]NIX84165.1 hypothetical protein [Gammaproteobacteria bacterium]